MRCLALSALASLLVTVASPARAAGECPDGDWFCEPAPPPPAPAPSPAPRRPAPLPPAPLRVGPEPPLPPPRLYPPPPPYYDDGRVRIITEPPPPRRHHRRRGYHEWGLNLHALVGLMGSSNAMSSEADMNGLGGALRFRPIPHIAIEAAPELAWGTDYNGFQRFEGALLVNGLFFANPHSAVQLYGVAGFGFGGASVDAGFLRDGRVDARDHHYRYFGTQLGLGVEGRVTRNFALGLDLLGFLRWRTDRHADSNPEYFDAVTGRSTNSSGGGLLRLGATFYW